MGGAIAQHVALAAPERVRTLSSPSRWAGSGAYAGEKTRLWASSAGASARGLHRRLLLATFSEEFYENRRGSTSSSR